MLILSIILNIYLLIYIQNVKKSHKKFCNSLLDDADLYIKTIEWLCDRLEFVCRDTDFRKDIRKDLDSDFKEIGFNF